MKLAQTHLVAAALIATLLATGCATDNDTTTPEPAPSTTEAAPEPEPLEEPPTSQLTGLPVDKSVLERPAVLVKVENSPQARPQSGLDAADIVFEEVVEGGVTRFFVVFQSTLPDTVGPVRSARPVDIDLMGIYGNALFAYSGARREVQTMLAGAKASAITEGFAGFSRDRQRRAPHNLYLDTKAAFDAAMTSRDLAPPPESGWNFDTVAPAGWLSCPPVAPGTTSTCTDLGQAITIRMSRGGYITNWAYDAPAGVYRRAQNGNTFTVTGAGQIGAANVVILATRHYVGQSGYPETDATTTGAPAVILRDGKRYAATWRKPSANAPLELLNTAGQPFTLKPGPTWIHLPPDALLPGTDQ